MKQSSVGVDVPVSVVSENELYQGLYNMVFIEIPENRFQNI